MTNIVLCFYNRVMKIALIADVHVDKNLPWTQKVWEAFLKRAAELKVEGVIIAGDLFENKESALALREWFSRTLEAAPFSHVIWVAGNHDLTDPTKDKQDQDVALADLNFGEKIEIFSKPHLYSLDGLEVFLYPFRMDPDDEQFQVWKLAQETPEPVGRRIGVGHGSLSDWISGIKEKEGSIIPRNFASMLKCERVFLGHIHERKSVEVYQSLGSARVWRKGETGDHGFWIYDSTTDTPTFVPLPEGRVAQEVRIFVFYDSFSPPHVDTTAAPLRLDISLYGVVESDHQKEAIQTQIQNFYAEAAEISFETKDLIFSRQIRESRLWRIFSAKWQAHYDKADPEKQAQLLLARELFIKNVSPILREG